MAKENKTQPTAVRVEDFISSIDHEKRRADAQTLHQMMQRVSGDAGRMWGASIVGYGDMRYRYATGREGDWFLLGFSPRKTSLSLYLCLGGLEQFSSYLDRLGKHKTGAGCLYINTLADVDLAVLEEMMHATKKHVQELDIR
jgi:hypothetical protein